MQEFFSAIEQALPEGLGCSHNTIQQTVSILNNSTHESMTIEVPPEAHAILKLLALMSRPDDGEELTPAWLLDLGCEGIGQGVFELQFVDDAGADSWIQFDPAEQLAEIHSGVTVSVANRGEVRRLLLGLNVQARGQACSTE